jgi:hypothetical protein
MKKLAFLGGALGVAAGALFVTHTSHAADHLDAPTIAMAANRMADINDVFAWMTSDGAKVNLAMTVSPADDGTHAFGPSVQYVFHVSEYAGATNEAAFAAQGTEHKVICTFASNTSAKCWITQGANVEDYVTGDPTSTTGLTSADGKVRLFAGRRSDPFFFNLGGFLTADAVVKANAGAFTDANGDGCPDVPATTAGALRMALVSPPATAQGPCAANQADCFANFNVMAIVLQVDKSLFLSGTNHLLSVWGSTHMGS